MKLIVGGACQGKLAFARELWEKTGCGPAAMADGRTDSWEEALKCPILYGFHQYLFRFSWSEEQTEKAVEELHRVNPDVLVVMDEIGCGIVPIDRKERRYREQAGRAGQRLASLSEEVYRVICGIGSRIK